MIKKAIMSSQHQDKVHVYFREQSSFWKDIYDIDADSGVYAQIHRDRHTAALAWIDDLELAPGASALDVGCGAGFMAIDLAKRGVRVDAVDSNDAMITQARQHVRDAGVADLLSLEIGDIDALAFADDSFDLVVALGVIPWLAQPQLAIREMSRVTKPGGYVLFTADNLLRLNSLLDPWLNPLVRPLKRGVKYVLTQTGLRQQSSRDVGSMLHSRRTVDALAAHAGLVKAQSKTLGFGPFTLGNRQMLAETQGIRLHRRLQSLADRGIFGLRAMGAHYLVLARKPVSG